MNNNICSYGDALPRCLRIAFVRRYCFCLFPHGMKIHPYTPNIRSCGICGGKIRNGAIFSLTAWIFSLPIVAPQMLFLSHHDRLILPARYDNLGFRLYIRLKPGALRVGSWSLVAQYRTFKLPSKHNIRKPLFYAIIQLRQIREPKTHTGPTIEDILKYMTLQLS